ncbi:MAG: transporter substrate-binding domain-containing protein [Lachnospiraceae bacterium]|nr:transporter substrate-binding domain-containing protein [Lachnospiraceae bacterium]
MVQKVKDFIAGNKWVLIPVIAVPVLIILFIIIFATGRGGAKKTTIADNAVPGVLRAGIVVADDQYAYKDEAGALLGIEPELAARAAEIENVSLQTKEYTSFEDALTALESGELDALFGRVSESNPLIGQRSVSKSYGQSGLYFLTGRYDYTDSLAMMGGKAVGIYAMVQPVSLSIPYIEGVGSKEYTDLGLLIQDVIQGNIDLAVVDERSAIASISEELQAQEIMGGPVENYVAVFNAVTPHLSAVNTAIDEYFDGLAAEE